MSRKAEHYARVHEPISQARGLKGQRLEAFLDSACGADLSLRNELRGLLDAGRDAQPGALVSGLCEVRRIAGDAAALPGTE